jgi:hypothetical protein
MAGSHDQLFLGQWVLQACRGGIRAGRRIPVAGELTLEWDTLTCTTDPDQQLVIWTAESGTPSHEGLRFLASWTAAERPRSSATGPV